MRDVFVAVGGNVDPVRRIPAALVLLHRAFPLVGVSAFYWTEPTKGAGTAPFVNGAVHLRSALAPDSLRARLRAIEEAAGRVRTADKNAPRPIDLDIALCGSLLWDDPPLPSPELTTRLFVAQPVYELAGDVTIPGTNDTLGAVCAALRATQPPMRPCPEVGACLREEIP